MRLVRVMWLEVCKVSSKVNQTTINSTYIYFLVRLFLDTSHLINFKKGKYVIEDLENTACLTEPAVFMSGRVVTPLG